AFRRALRVGGTRRARSRAALRGVTDACRATTFRAARNERVCRTIVARAIAGFGHVTDTCGATAFRRALRVGRTGYAGTSARFRKVPHTQGTTTMGAGR